MSGAQQTSTTSGTVAAVMPLSPAGATNSSTQLPVVTPPAMRQFSVDEYHRMVETAILTKYDKVELIDGWIVHMSPIGPPHCVATLLSERAILRVLPSGWHIRQQGPITLSTSEPEPDIAVVRGDLRTYTQQHPSGSDTALTVEISDSSLDFDRRVKASVYATALIPEYWIVNLLDRQLEVHREPQAASTGHEYRIREVLSADRAVSLSIDGKNVGEIRVADLLP
jgi:Uma2 family endonuclease